LSSDEFEGKSQPGRRTDGDHWNDGNLVAKESDEGGQSDELGGFLRRRVKDTDRGKFILLRRIPRSLLRGASLSRLRSFHMLQLEIVEVCDRIRFSP
jgi:hypothetical protein